MRGILRAGLALGLAGAVGCSTAARVRLDDRTRVSGRIVGGDAEVIRIETADGPTVIPRDRITAIAHPGKGAFISGVVGLVVALGLTGFGGYAVYRVETSADSDPQDGLAALPLVAGGIGLLVQSSVAGWGWRTWQTSLEAAEPPGGPH